MKAPANRFPTLAPIVAAALLLAACGKEPAAAPAPGEPAPAGAVAGTQGGAAPAGAPAATLQGTVLETLDAANYTYLRLKTAEGETWAAVNQSKVAVGDAVTVLEPMPMDGFESTTLHRTFERIVFGTLAAGPAPAAGAASGMAQAHGAVSASMAAQHAAAAGGPAETGKISVEKAPLPDGRTVAGLFAERVALKGKAVSVRGKVVKVNTGIMGRNWLHLRDGSGSPETKDHDLTVTTADVVAKGDVVLVKGTVAVDRDFGSGYTYALLLEDAKVTK